MAKKQVKEDELVVAEMGMEGEQVSTAKKAAAQKTTQKTTTAKKTTKTTKTTAPKTAPKTTVLDEEGTQKTTKAKKTTAEKTMVLDEEGTQQTTAPKKKASTKRSAKTTENLDSAPEQKPKRSKKKKDDLIITESKADQQPTTWWEAKQRSKVGEWWDRVFGAVHFRLTWFKSACAIKWRELVEASKGRDFRAATAVILTGVFFVSCILTYFLAFLPKGVLPIGMNIGTTNYYSRQKMFNDVFKTASTVRGAGGSWEEGVIPTDERGYPLEVPYQGRQAIFMFNNYYVGDYSLLFDGDGEFSGSESVEIVRQTQNRVDLKLTPFNGERFITIVRSNKDNPIDNIRIIPREYVGRESKMPVFRKAFIDGLEDMHAIRFMDATKTNGSTQQSFEERSKVGDFSMAKHGIPWEYLIDLCNEIKADGWFCVPHKASDDYIESLAKLIKARLNKRRTAYIEYSNEVWNGNFAQAVYVEQNAPDATDAYVSEELLNIGEAGAERHIKAAYMMSRTFRIFESVFKGKDRKRIITVGAIQTGNLWTLPQVVSYWLKHNNVPDAIAGTAYFGYETSASDDAIIPQNVISREQASELNAYFHNLWNGNPLVKASDTLNAVDALWDYKVVPNVYQGAALIRAAGARYLVYEGGQHMQPHNQGEWSYNEALYEAQLSPRMYDIYMKNFKLNRDVGCELFMNFSYVSANESRWGSWGVLNEIEDVYAKNLKAVSPKYKAVRDANARKGLFND